MDRLKLDGWCEKGILGLVLAILVFSPLATGCVRPQDFVVIEWLAVALLALWFCRFWLNPKHRLLWPPVCWAVLAFMVYAVLRYFLSDLEYPARQELIKVLIYGFLLFAIITNLHRLEFTQIVTVGLLSLGMLISLYAIYQFLSGSDYVWNFIRPEGYRRRGSGTFISPNNLACYLAMILPIGLAYTLTGRVTHLHKVLVGYAALAIFAGIVSTISRGGWLATLITLVVFFVFLVRQRDYRLQSLFLALALIGVAATSLGLAKLSEDRKKHLAVEAQTKEVRFRIWEPAVAMWKDHVWLGVGPDHFDTRFRQYRPPDAELQYRPGRVHNDYLNTLADWGAIGFVLIASVWGIFYWQVIRSWKYINRSQNDLAAKRSNKSSLVFGGALGLLAILLHSVVDFNFHVPANAILAVTLLGLIAGHFRFATERYWFTVRWPLKAVVTPVLLAAVCYLGAQSRQHTVESYWLGRAEADSNNVTNRIEDLKHAFAVEPRNFQTAYDLGETLRLLSWEGGEDFQNTATQAMRWFQSAIELNQYDPFSQIRLGMCLDWVGKHAEAEPYFAKANALDPNGFYTAAHVGWHYFQVADYPAAQKWFQRSLGLFWADNPISRAYLNILKDKLPEIPKS